MKRGGLKPTRKDRIMERERCDNCLYEYACDWRKAGEDLKCEDWKPVYQPQAYGTPYICPACGADQIKTEFYNPDGSEPKEKITYCWNCRQKLDWRTNI